MKKSVVQQDIDVIIKSIKKESKALEGKTILITGSSGFLGSYFLAVIYQLNRRFFKKPCKVIAVDNYITGNRKNILGNFDDKNFTCKEHDVRYQMRISEPLDYIIHAAGIASPVYYMNYPLETIEVSTRGTQHILNLARRKNLKSFLFFSSSEIYGDPHPDFIPTPETYRGYVSSIGPRACYDESKRLGETFCMTYHKLYNTPVKIVRPFNVYGPGMKPDDYRVMPRFLTNALRDEELPIHGKGLQTRTYCYVTDAIAGFFKVLLSKENGEVYNIGNPKGEINLINLAQLVTKLFKKKVKISKVPYPSAYPADEPNRRCPDISKAQTKLGYKPKVDIKWGLPRLLRWYREEFDFPKSN